MTSLVGRITRFTWRARSSLKRVSDATPYSEDQRSRIGERLYALQYEGTQLFSSISAAMEL